MQVIVRRDWLPFQFIHYDKHPYKMYLENNGHSAKVTFDPASCEDIPKLIQGNLLGRFFPVRCKIFLHFPLTFLTYI